MYVIRSKRIYLILACLLISTIAFNISTKKKEAVQTVALPINNKVIVLDAGHRSEKMDGGTSNNGISEAEINLKIALKVQKLIEASGGNVILTRSDENAIYDLDKKTLREKKISDIKNRVEIGNESSADIFISIHLNKIPQNQYWGWQTFYKNGDEKSQKLAVSMQKALNDSVGKENQRVSLKIENVYIIEHVEIPTAIVECGFLSNVEEEQLLQTEEYQDKLAWGIYSGIMDYFLE